ncbi:O-methyltransferase [Kribbella sp. NPDC055071]
MAELPTLVVRAQAAAAEIGMRLTREPIGGRGSACLPGVGRFLGVLAAGCVGGVIGEMGTGVGVGTAWMASAMPADCRLITVELDERRASAAQRVFASEPRVKVIRGDAFEVLSRSAPYDLLFADGGDAHPEALIDLVRVGGHLVMDDVTPLDRLPPDSPFRTDDPKRAFFANPRLISTEVVLPDLQNSLLAGTRAR